MKKTILTFLAASAVLISCNNNAKTANGADSTKADSTQMGYAEPNHGQPQGVKTAPKSGAVLSFDAVSYNFGKVKSGEKVTHDFKFKNTGKGPLIIADASASCGCTVPEYPKKPVAPGEEGIIKVVFNTEGKEGMQNKVVTVTSNADQAVTEIYLQGEVLAGAKKPGDAGHEGHGH